MTAEGPLQGWADPVATFLRANIPREAAARESPLAWGHMSSTAYQIGCMALIALGEATEMAWGATQRLPPQRPTLLPCWDDMAVAVLWLAQQQNQFAWRMADGGVPPRRAGHYIIHAINAPPPPRPTIVAAYGHPPAHASTEVMAVLWALGLVADGAWTNEAELVLWRCGQRGVMDTDPRFSAAVEICIATMPQDIRADLSGLVNISATDIAASLAHRNTEMATRATRHPNQFVLRQPTEEGIRRSLALMRGHSTNWIFFRRWRLPDGWLTPEQTSRALQVFHDPLGIAMRRHVVARLFPGSDLAAADWALGIPS